MIRFAWAVIAVAAAGVVTVLPAAAAQVCPTHQCPPASSGDTDTYECSD